jgi:amino acid transporter
MLLNANEAINWLMFVALFALLCAIITAVTASSTIFYSKRRNGHLPIDIA